MTSNNIIILWSTLAVLFFIVEIVSNDLMFLFLSMSSISIAIIAVTFRKVIVQYNIIWQLSAMSFLFSLYFLIFYKPLKRFLSKRRAPEYNDIIGSIVVIKEDIKSNLVGQADWSGTICRIKSYNGDIVKKGESARIVKIERNVFLVEKV